MEELLFKWGVNPNACQQCAAIAAVTKYFAGDVAEVVFELAPRILGPDRLPCGRSDAVGLLLECGADSAAENECGLTPLELAVKMDVGEAAGVSRLLPESRRRFFVELRWVFNSSIFFPRLFSMEQDCSNINDAILDGILDCAEKLIEQVDPNAVDELGRAPLHLAAERGYLGLVMLLLERGADPNLRDGKGRTPLHYAVARDNFIVAVLLDAGADPDVADDGGETPLHVAAYVRNYVAVQLLLKYAKRPNVNVQDEGGRTPLHLAARWCHVNVMWLLLVNGANPNIRDNSGDAPLHKAAIYRTCVDGVKMLLEAGADPNVENESGKTPLHYASMHGNPKMVSLLLRYGADPNVQDDLGRTPLHYAVVRGRAEAAEILLRHGADLTVADSEGKTPLDHARETGAKIAEVLAKAASAGRRWAPRQVGGK